MNSGTSINIKMIQFGTSIKVVNDINSFNYSIQCRYLTGGDISPSLSRVCIYKYITGEILIEGIDDRVFISGIYRDIYGSYIGSIYDGDRFIFFQDIDKMSSVFEYIERSNGTYMFYINEPLDKCIEHTYLIKFNILGSYYQ